MPEDKVYLKPFELTVNKKTFVEAFMHFTRGYETIFENGDGASEECALKMLTGCKEKDLDLIFEKKDIESSSEIAWQYAKKEEAKNG